MRNGPTNVKISFGFCPAFAGKNRPGTTLSEDRMRDPDAKEALCNRPPADLSWWHRSMPMKFKAIVHEAEEGGFWAEVPAIPGCATQGETLDELLANLREAIEGCLSVEPLSASSEVPGKIVEIAV
jgi:predicted RNase H-like HicB family nuclease